MGLNQHRQVEELYAFILVRRPCRRHRFLDDRPSAVERRFTPQISQPVPLRRGCERSQDLRGPRCESHFGQRGLRRLRTYPARRPGFAPNDRVVSYEAYVKEYNPTAYRPRWQNYFDQSFIKLRDVSLTWNIPQPWCAKLGLKSASLSFIGQNLLMCNQGIQVQRSRLHRPFDRRREPLVTVAPPDRL